MPAANPNSVLDSVKQVLGLTPDMTQFDLDIVMHINFVIGSLQQLGANNDGAFHILDNSTLWSAITSRQDLINLVRTYMLMRVRLVFDPPATSFAIMAIEKQIEELGWRINIMAESTYSPAPVIPAGVWWVLDGLSDFPVGAVIGDLGIDFTTGSVYGMLVIPVGGGMWNLTGLDDFPSEAIIGDLGYSTITGDVWRKTG